MKILLLLLGWAMIGNGMWYCKGGIQNKERYSRIKSVSAWLNSHVHEVKAVVQQYQYEKLLEEHLELNRLHKKLIPQDKIKITLNNTDMPDCHYPYKIVQTHKRRSESITTVTICAQDCRVNMLPNYYRKDIKVSLFICASERMCQKYFKNRGCVKQIDHELYIVLPSIEHKFVSCNVEYPLNQPLTLERITPQEFMKRFEKEPEFSDSDSSDLDLSSEEEDGE